MGEEHVIPKEGIKGVVSSLKVVDNETVEIDEGGVLSATGLDERSTDTTSMKADEELFAESID